MLSIRNLVTILLAVLTLGSFAQDIDFVVQTGHASGVTHAKFSHSGKLLASAGEDNNVVLWEVESGRQLRLLHGHQQTVNQVKFLKGDSLLLSCSEDQKIILWRVKTGQIKQEWKFDQAISAIDLDLEEKMIYCASKDLYKVSIEGGNPLVVWRIKKHPFTQVKIAKNNMVLFGSAKENFFYQLKDSLARKTAGSVRATVLSKDMSKLFVSSRNGHVNEFSWKEDHSQI